MILEQVLYLPSFLGLLFPACLSYVSSLNTIGVHEKPPHNQDSYLLRKFGNLIGEYYARIGSEAVVDKLADLLVDICNCDREVLQSVSKLPMNTKVCHILKK